MSTEWDPENDPQVRALTVELREKLTFDVATKLLAAAMVYIQIHDEHRNESDLSFEKLREYEKQSVEYGRAILKFAEASDALAKEALKKIVKAKDETTRRAKKAANTRHGGPGGSREKQQGIRAMWATGKYQSRDICAEQESAALGMSFSAARKALRNTADPT